MPGVGSLVNDAKYAASYEQDRLSLIRSLIPHGSGDALDLRCGSGYISRIMSEHGWSDNAIDANPANIVLARQRVPHAICGDAIASLAQLVSGQYTLICALELIEHLLDHERPVLLGELRRISALGATVIISSPNRMSPEGLYEYYWLEKLRKLRSWKAWALTHQRIYSSFELLAEIRRCGFIPHRVVGHYYKGQLSLPLSSSCRFPLNRFGFNTIVSARTDG